MSVTLATDWVAMSMVPGPRSSSAWRPRSMLRTASVGLISLVAAVAGCSGDVEAAEVRTYAPWAPGGGLNEDVELERR